MTEPLLIAHTTVASEADAERLATALIEQKVAACVQIMPVRSVYRWRGAVETDDEWRLEIKTPASRRSALENAVMAHHPYDTPEWVVLTGEPSAAYGDWARGETTSC